VREFVRVLDEGGLLVFDLPSFVPLKHRVQPRTRLFLALRRIGFSTRLLYRLLRAYPMPTTFVPEADVTQVVEWAGARLLDVRHTPEPSGVRHSVYYATK
jgi:hypothetical protein